MVRFTSIGCVAAGLAALLSSCNPDAPRTSNQSVISPSDEPTVAAPAESETLEAEPETTSRSSVAASGTTASGTTASGTTAPKTTASGTDESKTTGPETTAPQTTAPETAQTASNLSSQPIFELIPGRYCYRLDNGIRTTHLRLKLAKDNQFQGEARSTIQNDEAAYYTSYAQRFTGGLTNFDAAVDMTTWIEYDVQNAREDWHIHRDQLRTEDATLDQVDCQLVDPVFQSDSGLEARDLLDGATAVHRQDVAFAAGESSATVSNAVVRGERDVYLLGARGGQQMDLSITSLEDNAVFDVISPSGDILALEAMNETIFLPHTGDYQVIVGGTRGNASYDLTMGIQ